MNVQVIIPAAGSGKRFGAKKQFLSLWGQPVLLHSLRLFEKSPLISGICVVTLADEVELVKEWVREAQLKKVHSVIVGGAERQDSVRLGFMQVPACDVIMVHDGVRPFVSEDMLERLLQGVNEVGSAIIGVPSKETLKKERDGLVQETIDRKPIWSIQTPQCVRYDIFKKAITLSQEQNFLGTDESMLVERAGYPVKIVLGSPYNIKITTPEDLVMAEALKGVLCKTSE